MKVIRRSQALLKTLTNFRSQKETVGFVPTMGYLHEGHLSLVRRAAKENDRVVVSIFVNPLQFGPKEDLSRYPRDARRDQKLLKNASVDVLYMPEATTFYGPHFQTSVSLSSLSRPLCGASRPTHFAGVATVVLKLLNQISPDALYLGQKDYQQFRVLEQMVKDLSLPVKVKLCPIVRERDGLAMSSRNIFLDAQERAQAVHLNKALSVAENSIRAGQKSAAAILKGVKHELSQATRAKIDYAEIVDAQTLLPVVQLNKGQKVEVALAVFFSKTRLIDNRLIEIS